MRFDIPCHKKGERLVNGTINVIRKKKQKEKKYNVGHTGVGFLSHDSM